MPPSIDLTGIRFHRLVAVKAVVVAGVRRWVCKCDCGNESTVRTAALRNGNTGSCGCWKREVLPAATTKHGLSTHPLYATWKGMRNRCNNPRAPRYKDYGGRGIAVCKRWDKFQNFLADMGERPPGTTLDRKNNDRGYSKRNCRWATPAEQSSNKRVKPSLKGPNP
jgi:hypothetical protein